GGATGGSGGAAERVGYERLDFGAQIAGSGADTDDGEVAAVGVAADLAGGDGQELGHLLLRHQTARNVGACHDTTSSAGCSLSGSTPPRWPCSHVRPLPVMRTW